MSPCSSHLTDITQRLHPSVRWRGQPHAQPQPSSGRKTEAMRLGGDTVNLPVIQRCLDTVK